MYYSNAVKGRQHSLYLFFSDLRNYIPSKENENNTLYNDNCLFFLLNHSLSQLPKTFIFAFIY